MTEPPRLSISNDISSKSKTFGAPDRWFVLSLLALNYFTLFLHRNLINYLQPALIKDVGLTDTQLGLLHWGFLLPYALSQVFVGYLGDRYRRRAVLLASLSSSIVILILTGLARNFAELFALRVLLAITQSASVPAIAGIMADCFTSKNRSKAVSIYLLSSPFSLIVAGWLGGKVADVAGWRMVMFVFAGFGAVVAFILYLLLREPDRTDRKQDAGLGAAGAPLSTTLRSVLNAKSFLLLAIAYVIVSNVAQISIFWLPRYFHDLFDMNMESAGRLATVWSQGGTVVGLLLGGVWADVWSRCRMSGRFLVQLIGLSACAPALLVMGASHSEILLSAAMFLFGLASWLYFANLWTTTFEVVDPAARSTAIGLLNVASGVLGAWVSPMTGYLLEHAYIANLGVVFIALALLLAFPILLLTLIVTLFLPHDYRGA